VRREGGREACGTALGRGRRGEILVWWMGLGMGDGTRGGWRGTAAVGGRSFSTSLS
jgi:hypothetical protein